MDLSETALQWGGYSFSAQALWERDGKPVNGRQTCDTHYAPIPLAEVPAGAALAAELGREGYTCTAEPSVSRSKTTTTWTDGRKESETSFGLWFTLKAKRGNGEINCEVRGGGKTPAEAVLSATVVREYSIYYAGPPIAGGKGQKARCLEAARAVMAEHARARNARRIWVAFETRGGRGGWSNKTAHHDYTPLDVIAADLGGEPANPGAPPL